MRVEKVVLNEEREVTLTAYLLGTGGEYRFVEKRPAVLILPGGGYQYCSDREADPVAMPYLKAGYQAFILRYSVGKAAVWPNPLNDYEQAMGLIRSRAGEWGLFEDKIAVIGFSAGGHLAVCAAAMSVNRPNAAILGYAVCGKDVTGCLSSAPDAVQAVDEKTCPCFVFATRDDNVVNISNSLQLLDALAAHDIAFESHIYAYGPHGFSTCDHSVQSRDTVVCSRTPHWVEDSIGWLKDIFGDFGEGKMTEPVCKGHVNGNMEDFLSVRCTYSYLMKHKEAAALMGPVIKGLAQTGTGNEKHMPVNEESMKFLGRMRLLDLLSYGNVPEEMIKQLDEKLGKIPNKE